MAPMYRHIANPNGLNDISNPYVGLYAKERPLAMRIAQVAPLYESVPPRLYGGTERVVSWLTEKLVALGHDVTLYASGDSITRAKLVPACTKAIRLDPNGVDPLARHMLMLERVFSQAEDFDLIHFHVDYLHFPMSRRSQVPTVTTLHGRLDLPDLPALYQEFSEMPLISISDAQRKPLAWANWLATVAHGMPAKSLRFNPDGGKYLAFLGRISPEKGPDRAIEIATRLGMKLKVAAKVDRADQRYFERTIEPLLNNPLVEFVGEVGNAEKSEFLGNASALLFPIDWPEPFGLVMIEALACGTPVIAFPHGSVPEVVVDGVCGFLVNDVAAAVDAVSRIGEIDRRACRRHFERNFTDDRMARNYLHVYEQLVDSDSGADSVRSDSLGLALTGPHLTGSERVSSATPRPVLQKGVLKWIELKSPSPSTT